MSESSYEQFLAGKARTWQGSGLSVDPASLHPSLFAFQRDLTAWALRKGRAALFTGTGTGKTRQQVQWADRIPGEVLILAPLCVAPQTVREAEAIGVEVRYARSQADVRPGITISNYEMLEHFDPTHFTGVVLDESSRIKDHTAKQRTALIEAFRETPYRLCCTATPAPNDYTEFANHAEFLGIMTRAEMLASYFVHREDGWRLKGHASTPFFRHLASWSMSLNRPSDLGYPDAGYILPALTVTPEIVRSDYVPAGQLFATGLKGITDRSRVRQGTVRERVQRAATLIMAEPDQQWIAWTGLNEESSVLAAALPDAVEVTGSMSLDEKESRIGAFLAGSRRVIVTKGKIAGFGINAQCAARQVFVGLNDSWELWYQCIRRSWRFGQTQPVHIHAVITDLETPIYDNIQRKERQALAAQEAMVRAVAGYERDELATGRQTDDYQPREPLRLPDWLQPTREAVSA